MMIPLALKVATLSAVILVLCAGIINVWIDPERWDDDRDDDSHRHPPPPQ